ncbi:uncharacterized protein SAPINGB_P005983 [Magnusiomyces paraingens]|uniref:TauD/TfdA-like domain-containing protein n=1 Tax=Magnusiomyces paraingens TaxID=2606893 RepID=A0A5E8C3S1_9ASCO|nr:uncharacterized protein SAPINGB_P005983 [Saprochaete ingens]VVT57992.1 unnamed protein product [Saprochaete ingens]
MGGITDLRFVVHDPVKFPDTQEEISGPSPYWNTPTRGPSYIKPENRQKPLKSKGKLDSLYSKYSTDMSPLLGTTYSVEARITDILKDDDLLHDLALLVSQRGVVIFKKQEDLTVDQQKDLVQKLGILSGKPKNNGLHIHPTTRAGGVITQNGTIDPEVSFISTRISKKINIFDSLPTGFSWHSDITFEPVGSDYSSFRLVELPPLGGDTFFANGYALYEKLSPPLREFFEGLTGTYSQPKFNDFGRNECFKLYTNERGAPENVGEELIAVHPIVRTNPVTGWKSLFAVGGHFTKFNELSPLESKTMKEYIWNTLVQAHEIQVRHRWDKHDVAIWDNRSSYHAINRDIYHYKNVIRSGIRTVGIAERPYLDPNSITQTEGLSLIEKEIEEVAKKQNEAKVEADRKKSEKEKEESSNSETSINSTSQIDEKKLDDGCQRCKRQKVTNTGCYLEVSSLKEKERRGTVLDGE